MPASGPGVAFVLADLRDSLPIGCVPPGGVPAGTKGVAAAPATGVTVVSGVVAVAAGLRPGAAVTVALGLITGAAGVDGMAVAAGVDGACVTGVSVCGASGVALLCGVADNLGVPGILAGGVPITPVADPPGPVDGVAVKPGGSDPPGGTVSGRLSGVAPRAGVCTPPKARPRAVPGCCVPTGTPASTDGVTTARAAPGVLCRLLRPRPDGVIELFTSGVPPAGKSPAGTVDRITLFSTAGLDLIVPASLTGESVAPSGTAARPPSPGA